MKTLNYNARFIQLAGEINSDMPRYWVEKAVDALNGAGKPPKNSRVLVLGVAYKKDIDDLRESLGAGHHRAAPREGRRTCATTTPTCRSSRTTAMT